MANPFLVLGGVAVGVITAGIGALQVPGWVNSANDANAIGDLSLMAQVQGGRMATVGSYATTVSDLTTGDNIRFSPSQGARLYTSVNPAGTDWVGVARSKTGSYFARLSATARSGKGSSIEAAIIAAGTTISGPANARVTAEGVPVPAPYALSDVLATNLFRNADARTIDGFAAFWGTGGNGTTVSVAAPWAESGRAVRFTQTVTASNNPHFDLRPGHWMEAGKRYTMVWDVVGPGTYSSTGGLGGYPTVGLVAQSPLRTEVVGSTPRRMWATVDVPAGGLPGGWQVYLSLPTSAGQWVEFGNAHMYEGDYDPSREWFSGSGSATPGAQTAWTGTPDASPAVLYR